MFNHRKFDRILDRNIFEIFLRKREDPSPINFDFFPPTGVIVFYAEKPICIGFMIKCDNNTCINTDLISDPSVDASTRNLAVIHLREALAEEARKCNIKYIIAVTNNAKLVERLKEQGYTTINENLTHLGRPTWL